MTNKTDAIAITLFESDKFGGWKIMGGQSPTLRANKVCVGIIEITEISKDKAVEYARSYKNR